MVVRFNPGEMLVNNTVLRQPSFREGYCNFLNQDTQTVVRCQIDFPNFNLRREVRNAFYEVLALGQDNGIQYPIVVSSRGDLGYLLAPPLLDNSIPGMVIADLVFEMDFSKPRKDLQSSFSLRYSDAFHSDKIECKGRNFSRPNKYEVMVREPTIYVRGNVACQGLIRRVYRIFKNGVPQNYKHVNASAIFYYDNPSLFEKNKLSLENFLNGGSKIWWNNLDNGFPMKVFESITGREIQDICRGISRVRQTSR